MTPDHRKHPSTAASLLFGVLDPLPIGFFVAAMIFDLVYVGNADVMWFKSAAWLISIGLLFAVVPRVINLARVWFPGGMRSTVRDKAAFFLYLLGVVAAIANAFVHSRDAYGVIPDGVWLSISTVILLVAAMAVLAFQDASRHNDHRVLA